jgi:hypothetical protein
MVNDVSSKKIFTRLGVSFAIVSAGLFATSTGFSQTHKSASPELKDSNKPTLGETPKLKQGLWEIERVIDRGNGTRVPLKATKCTDPVQTLSNYDKTIVAMGCTTGTLTRAKNTFTRVGECPTPQGLRKTLYELKSLNSDEYLLKEVTSGAGSPTLTSTTTAKRVGDC